MLAINIIKAFYRALGEILAELKQEGLAKYYDMRKQNQAIVFIFYFIMFYSSKEKQVLDYQVASHSLETEVCHKIMLLGQFNYDMEQIASSDMRPDKASVEIVRFSRKIIEESQRIVIAMKEYLRQLGIDYLHELIAQMFKILIICFNSLSEKFLLLLKEKKENDQQHQNFVKSTKSMMFNKSTAEAMVYLDDQIKEIEVQQMKLQQQRKAIEKQIVPKGKSPLNITASDAVSQLQILSCHLHKIIMNTEKFEGENVLQRYQELSKKILALKKPENLDQFFFKSLSSQMKMVFISTMERIIKELQINITIKQTAKVREQFQRQKPILEECSTQTNVDGRARQIEGLQRDKKSLLAEVQHHKKICHALHKQVDKLTDKHKQERDSNVHLLRKIQSLQDLLRKKNGEILKMRAEYEDVIRENNFTIQSLVERDKERDLEIELKNKTIAELTQKDMSTKRQKEAKKESQKLKQVQSKYETPRLGSRKPKIQQPPVLQTFQQEPVPMQLNIAVMNPPKMHLAQKGPKGAILHLQNQLKLRRKQNAELRKGLVLLLEKCAEIKLIPGYSANEFNRDLKLGKFSSKLQKLTSSLKNNISLIRQKPAKAEQMVATKPSNYVEESEIKRLETQYPKGVQKQDNGTQTISMSSEQESPMDDDPDVVIRKNKLQTLKKQLIDKLSLQKKSSERFSRHMFKTVFSQMTAPSRESVNLGAGGFRIQQKYDDVLPAESSLKKKMSFQGFQISSQHDKTGQQKPSFLRQTRRLNTIIDENKQQQLAELIIKKKQSQDESSEMLGYLKSILQSAEVLETEREEQFILNFIRAILQNYRKKKGRLFFETVIKNQMQIMASRASKINRTEMPSQFTKTMR